MEFLPEELDQSDSAEILKWDKFEKSGIIGKGCKSIKMPVLVKNHRHPMESLPFHEHKAQRQNGQYRS